MRLLIVEDEEKTRTYLCKGLKEAGFVVDSADDGVGADDYVVKPFVYAELLARVRALTRRAQFLLLALLMRRQGEVLSRTLIASQVWDINFDSDLNLVDVSVGRPRRKVDGDSQLKLIHTVRGVGFVLEAR